MFRRPIIYIYVPIEGINPALQATICTAEGKKKKRREKQTVGFFRKGSLGFSPKGHNVSKETSQCFSANTVMIFSHIWRCNR